MHPNDLRLDGQAAFITAGANGIGAGIAQALADLGVRAAIADIDADAGHALEKTLRERAGDALFVQLDVNDGDALRAAIAQASMRFGRLDILVNNAGGVRPRAFLEQNESNWRRLIDFNLVSTLVATQEATKAMIAAGNGGTILNIASSEGLRAAPNYAVYAACKAALISFTRSMALELSAHDIRVHALAPDMIETVGLRRWFDAEGEAGKAARERYIPLRRSGSVEELASIAAFLCSRLSSYTTGLTIPVDGGTLASSGWTRSPHDDSWGLYHG